MFNSLFQAISSLRQKLKLIEVLMAQAGSVKVALLLDKQYPHDLPDPRSLFYEGTNLSSALSTSKTEANPDSFRLCGKKEVLITNPDLQGLNDYWIQSQEHLPPSAADWRAMAYFCGVLKTLKELTHVATEIRRLVVEEGIGTKEIQVLTRDLDCYENLLEPILRNTRFLFMSTEIWLWIGIL